MDYLEKEKQEYEKHNEHSHSDWAVDVMIKESWKKGFMAGVDAALKKHNSFLAMFSFLSSIAHKTTLCIGSFKISSNIFLLVSLILVEHNKIIFILIFTPFLLLC